MGGFRRECLRGPWSRFHSISWSVTATQPRVHRTGDGGADEALAVGQAVDHDIASGATTEAGSALAVVGVGVRRLWSAFVVLAGGVAVVDDVMALGCAGVALALFGWEAAGPSATL